VSVAVYDAAERQFKAWLSAFNSADRDTIAAYRDQAFAKDLPDWPPVDDEREFAEQTGGFELIKIEDNAPTKLTAIVKERGSDQFGRASFEVDAAAPHTVRKFSLKAIPTPEEFATPRLSEADALAALRTELDKRVAADQFSGAVVVAKFGKQIFAQAYGLADRDKKIANTIDTRFRIGSMNKMFTAVATLQLVQAGKLELDDTVGKHLPGYPNQDIANKVTIHHLLSHTGGTGDFFGPEFDKKRLELKTHDDYVKLYGERAPKFEPGTKWAYSNYGFLLLGAIIEKVTRKSYYDVVQANVYKRAGMKSTSSPPEDKPQKGRSVGYMRPTPKAPWKPNTDTLPARGTAAGGGDSTVLDLMSFGTAIVGRKLLDAKHTELLTSPKEGTPTDIPYGYGFTFAERGGVRCVGHGGGAPGMNGELLVCDSGYTIAVLANIDPPAASKVADFIIARLPVK
jgi:D-alanyl-D-alanine carboxypeptidase